MGVRWLDSLLRGNDVKKIPLNPSFLFLVILTEHIHYVQCKLRDRENLYHWLKLDCEIAAPRFYRDSQ